MKFILSLVTQTLQSKLKKCHQQRALSPLCHMMSSDSVIDRNMSMLWVPLPATLFANRLSELQKWSLHRSLFLHFRHLYSLRQKMLSELQKILTGLLQVVEVHTTIINLARCNLCSNDWVKLVAA